MTLPNVAMDGELIAEGERERPSGPGSLLQRPLPWLVISLIIINWAAFLYSLYKNNCPNKIPRVKCLLRGIFGRFSFQPFEQNTQFGPAMSTLVDLGAFKWDFEKEQTNKWHILSSIFFHRGLASLILDTISLIYVGMELEQKFGIVKIGSLYFLAGLGGSLWASLRIEGVVYVGGPSGVCGLTGGAFAELFINSNMYGEKFKRFRSLCLGVAFNFGTKLFPWTDVTGNIGGLYMGFLLGFLLLIRPQPQSTGREYKHSGFYQLLLNYSWYQVVLFVISLISTVVQFLYSLIKYIFH